jgi:hypothetical protein
VKLVQDNMDVNGFYEGSGEVYVSGRTNVSVYDDKQFQLKAEVNIPAESLIWGQNGTVVTAGRAVNIGTTNGQTKCM